MVFRKVHVVINPASGKNEAILNTLNDVFRAYECAWDVSITHANGDGARAAKQAVAAGCDLVMAYGGDGTQRDVAGGLMHTNVPLGILPGGTANAFAAELGIPFSLEAAARVPFQENHTVRAIDVGEMNDHHFLLHVGTGMVGIFSESVTRTMKDRYGMLAYILGGVQAISQPQFSDYTLTIDGETIKTNGTACLISNVAALSNTIRLSSTIKPDDGLLDVHVLRNDLQTVLGVLSNLAQLDDSPLQLDHWQCHEIHIEAHPAQGIYGDGEEVRLQDTPVTLRNLTGALRVVAPAIATSVHANRENIIL